MSESPKNKFEEIMKKQGLEKISKPTSEQFEELMRKNGLENIIGKEGHVFIVSGKDKAGENFTPLTEFDTADEARDWYNSFGRLITEKGGEISLRYGVPELTENSAEYYIVKYFDPSLPESQSIVYDKFRTKADRYKWYKEFAMEIIRIHGGRFELPEEPVVDEEEQKSGQ